MKALLETKISSIRNVAGFFEIEGRFGMRPPAALSLGGIAEIAETSSRTRADGMRRRTGRSF